MAVELRCPDCRAKLRLPDEPEPGSDVECPECNAVFPAPDPDTGEVLDESMTEIARLTVTQVKEKLSIAGVSSGDTAAIEKGMRVHLP